MNFLWLIHCIGPGRLGRVASMQLIEQAGLQSPGSDETLRRVLPAVYA